MARIGLLIIPLLVIGAGQAQEKATVQRKSVQEWLNQLQEKKGKERIEAAQALGDFGAKAKEATGALVALLKESDKDLRLAALGALRRIGPHAKDAVPALIRAVKDLDRTVREFAVRTLAAIGPRAKDAESVLIDALAGDVNASREAARALSAIEATSPAAIEALCQSLRDEDVTVRREAARALKDLAPPAAVPALGESLKPKEDLDVRLAALGALAAIGPKANAATPALVKAIADKNSSIRLEAVNALLAVGASFKDTAQALRGARDDISPRVRIAVAVARIRLSGDSREGLPTLVELLSHEDPGIRGEAAHALGTLGKEARDAVKALREILEEPKDAKDQKGKPIARVVRTAYERREAALALVRITGEAGDVVTAVTILRQGLSDMDADVRGMSAAALTTLGPAAKIAVPDLVPCLKHPSPIVRGHAARALGNLGAKDFMPDLKKLLSDKDARVCVEAAAASIRLDGDSADALPILERGLEEASLETRATTITRLGELGPTAKPLVPSLRDALLDPSPRLRRLAAQALLKIQNVP
jgi:HEAT repeat protein